MRNVPGAAGFRGLTRKTCQVGAMDWEKKKGQQSAYFFAAKGGKLGTLVSSPHDPLPGGNRVSGQARPVVLGLPTECNAFLEGHRPLAG